MNTTEDLIKRELPLAIGAAREAGRAALEFYGGPLRVERKPEMDEPVTQADHAANDVIVSTLRREFPADGLLSEELPDDSAARLSKRRVWVVDPLDGTSGFIDGNGDFAVQIGLVVDGQPALGVVYVPAADTLYRAVLGGGAWISRAGEGDERLSVATADDFARMRLAVSRSHRSPRMNRVAERFGFRGEIQRGSVGVKIGLIVERRADLYIHLSPRTKQWDTCAPQIVLHEAGGRLSDIFGQPLRYDTADVRNLNGLVASNSSVHPKLIGTLRPLLDEFDRRPA